MPEQETQTHLVSKFSLTVKTENGNVAESREWIYKMLSPVSHHVSLSCGDVGG